MPRAANDVMQSILFSAVLDGIAALKRASGGLPNQLLRDVQAIHPNVTFADLPKELQDAIAEGRGGMVYYAFDLLFLDGEDLRKLPLIERKSRLAALLEGQPPGGPIFYSDHVVGNGAETFAHACEMGLEGIVSKRADAPYRAGRGRDWVKVKCIQRQEMVIGGWTDPQGSRTGFGALLIGYHDADGQLRYAGKVGTGFNDKTLGSVMQALRKHGLKAILPGVFPDRAFSTEYALKDLSYALELASDAGIKIRGAELIGKILQETIDAGSGDAYFPVLAKHIGRP